jgi:hypothetical protein
MKNDRKLDVHPFDLEAACPSCGRVGRQRYDATQIVDRRLPGQADDAPGEICEARQYTHDPRAGGCGQTFNHYFKPRPDLTVENLLDVLDLRVNPPRDEEPAV